MQIRVHWGAAGCGPLWLAAWLPTFGGCVAATQAERYDALVVSVAESVVVSTSDPGAGLFPEDDSLSREALIGAVLGRNPTVESARQAWREALSRYPQAISRDDPKLSYESAPRTIGSERGYRQVVRLSQRIEWPGKQELHGALVLAEAEARSEDFQEVRLHLALTASLLFDDHYVVGRALEINRGYRGWLERSSRSAEAHYVAGRGSQQDPLWVEVELVLLEREQLVLEARRRVIAAQINGLLHRDPSASVPPPPGGLEPATAPAMARDEWSRRALRASPTIQASAIRRDGAQSSLALAQRAQWPDLAISGSYNSMWPHPEHQLMLGFSLEIPLHRGRVRAVVDEASARLARAEAEHEAHLESVRVEVHEALLGLEEALAREALTGERLLPVARQRLSAAEAGYRSGHGDFSDLVEAERRLRAFELEHEEALADTWRRRACLARAAGASLLTNEDGGPR